MFETPRLSCLALAVCASALSLVACSAANTPPPSGEPVITEPSGDGGTTIQSQTCTTEGAVDPCASLGEAGPLSMVRCSPGTRTCAGGVWSKCTALPGSANEWYPASATCDPCTTNGETRVCKIMLPDQGATHACATGK